jgi:UDP-glucose:(glucosyl)LPS alpha-1,2-glucosyltransferase
MGGIAWDPGSHGSFGGTEIMGRELERRVPTDLLGGFQIHMNRPATPQDQGRVQILWCHITATAPECAHLAHGGWNRFQRIVFVSNWQAQAFIKRYGIPWSRCLVIPNAIEPFAGGGERFRLVSSDRPIRLIYTAVPYRGLVVLYAVFRKICAERDDVELDVFSSLRLYGWDDSASSQPLFDALRQHPRVNYHGTVPNGKVRSALAGSHIFAYPALEEETSCLCLMEAMSAGLACVHPNYGALYETAADCTSMYQWQDEPDTHAAVLYENLMTVITALRQGDDELLSRLAAQKAYADEHYSWARRAAQWEAFLRSIVHLPP